MRLELTQDFSPTVFKTAAARPTRLTFPNLAHHAGLEPAETHLERVVTLPICLMVYNLVEVVGIEPTDSYESWGYSPLHLSNYAAQPYSLLGLLRGVSSLSRNFLTLLIRQ